MSSSSEAASSASSDASRGSSPGTTAPSSPKLGGKVSTRNVLPSPFIPPSVAQQNSIQPAFDAPPLPSEYPTLPSTVRPDVADPQDENGPDKGILRDRSMVRLTGKWPFNSEPPLPALYDSGFLTPTRLFYVRNHGVAPQVSQADAEAWTVTIDGLVEKPLTITLADLIELLPVVTLPVTLVCAGNRRKEQNVVQKSLGFSWGPAGLSTALFTGVYLSDVLDLVRPRNEGHFGEPGFRRAEHVIFEGAEDLPNGKYGTSQRLRWARQKEKGMMLAWAMNGEALEPDHGYPLRLVVPGQIGGRSVKWLKRIEVSDRESQHHLHFWDNKVLPATLTAEEARDQRDWWYDPRYIINDLNTNSAIARPAHDEQLPVAADSDSDSYTIEGYAYAGGGRRVNRVEVTLDDGAHWILANVTYPEDEYRKVAFEAPVWGKLDITDRDECFCWVLWKVSVPVRKLVESSCIAVRGCDEGLSLQGKSMYWNPTGMMNNWWFRVAIHQTKDIASGGTLLRFEHPTMPGLQPGGWMVRMRDEGADTHDILNPVFGKSSSDKRQLTQKPTSVTAPAVSMVNPEVKRRITIEELRAHNKEDEPWFAVNGEVYDGTAFLSGHPGGAESITLVAGEDASEDFMAIHSIDAKKQLAAYHIGTLVPALPDTSSTLTVTQISDKPDPIFLSKTKWKAARLIKIQRVNHDSRIYRFALEDPEQLLGLPTGQHVYARLRRKKPKTQTGNEITIEGELVQRAYTPLSPENAKGTIDMLIKVYFRTDEYPEGGKMTLGFEELEVGDSIEFKGPLGSFRWLGGGTAEWKGVKRTVRKIGMICAGSGVTPIIQVLRGIVNDEQDTTTETWIVNGNRTEDDILLKSDLDELVRRSDSRVRQHYVLSKGSDAWTGARGRIDKEMLKRHLPAPAEDALLCICGPDALIEAVKKSLAELGWNVPNALVVF
ncbi:hypothetical protein ACM66B_001341 [Microbotryomycetes sp. NB124-2]